MPVKREPAEPQGSIKPTGVGIPRLQAGEEVNAYGITDEDIRKGMGECEKRFRDGDAGGRKTVEENTIIDGLAELSTRLQKVQSAKIANRKEHQ